MSKANAQDVYEAFLKYRVKDTRARRVELYDDGSGAMTDGEGKALFLFDDFDHALKQFSSLEHPHVGESVAQGPYLFTVTNLYEKSLRADRALYGDGDYVVYVPFALLTRRPGTRIWAVGE